MAYIASRKIPEGQLKTAGTFDMPTPLANDFARRGISEVRFKNEIDKNVIVCDVKNKKCNVIPDFSTPEKRREYMRGKK